MEVNNTIIKELIKDLKNTFQNKLKKIYLFGSYARKNNGKESDIDFIAIIDDKKVKKYENRVLDIMVDLSVEYDAVISIFIEDETNYMKFKDIRPLYKNIENEGIEVYAA